MRSLRLLLAVLITLAPALSLAAVDAEALRVLAEQHLLERAGNLPGKVRITVATPRLPDIACSQAEAFDDGTPRRWGKTSVGLRCIAGAQWSLFVGANVRVDGSWVVTNRALLSGQEIAAADLRIVEGELSAQPVDVMTDPAEAIGRTTRQSLAAGAVLRSMQLRETLAVQAGQSIKLITRGAGFSVTNDGKALHNAQIGQSLRVKTRNGQVLSGIVRAGGWVEMAN